MPTVLFPRPGQNTLPFPVEIVDYIIDFLHKDKNSLSSCALVSRAFVASSQYHLFCMLSFRWKEGLDFAYVVPFFHERTPEAIRQGGLHCQGIYLGLETVIRYLLE